MDRISVLFLILTVVISCNVQVNKPVIVDEKYEPTDEELFAACADLQGVGQFVIGKTRFKTVINDKDFRSCSDSFERKSNLYNGHWGFECWRSIRDDISTSLKKARWIEEESKERVKQLRPGYGGIQIGDLKFETFDMAFLNDTLIAIFFYPEREIEREVINHLENKYGKGRGYYKYYDSSIKVGDAMKVTTTKDEKHTWANETVALDYVNESSFHVEPGKQPSSYSKHSLLIYDKSRLPFFEEQLKSLAKQYDEIKQESTNKSLSSL